MISSSFITKLVLMKSGAVRVYKKNGRCDEYAGVGREIYDKFCKAKSKGKFYNSFIKGKFAHKVYLIKG